MTTIQGLFAAGDGVGAAPHKFSSGSFTEGRLAAKAAVRYVLDHPSAPTLNNSVNSPTPGDDLGAARDLCGASGGVHR